MRKHIFTLMALAAALCACNKEQMIESEVTNPEIEPSAPLVFTATMEGVPGSKATLADKTPNWEVGDQISINGFHYAANAAGTSTTFSETSVIRPVYVSTTTPNSFNNNYPPLWLVDEAGPSQEWCAHKNHKVDGVWNIVVSTGNATTLKSIQLWNARNTQNFPDRSWKDVNIYGSTSADGPWGDPIKSFQDLDLAINNYGFAGELEIDATRPYTFYRIDVLDNKGSEYAQMSDMKFVISNERRPAFVSSTDTGSHDNQPASNLVDDKGTSTRWIADKTQRHEAVWNIVISTGSNTLLKTIKLWNADNQTNPGRRWKYIQLYGRVSDSDPWYFMNSFNNLNLAKNNKGFAGEIEVNSSNAYTLYKIDVLDNEGDNYMQMSDMKFTVDPAAPYYAYFPASLFDGYKATLPSTISETWAEGKFNMPMYAHSNTTNLEFKNLCGVLKIAVKKETIASVKSIRISSSNKATSGAFTVSNNTAVLASPDVPANTLTVMYTNAVKTSDEGTAFYVAIPAQTYQKLKIELSSDGVNYTKSVTTTKNVDIAVARNKIYPINFTDIANNKGRGKAKATIDGQEVDVDWVQLWEDGPKFAKFNVGAANFQESDNGGLYPVYHIEEVCNWGSAWRLPTADELRGLNNCEKSWTKISGTNGRLYTGIGEYANNSIFLPAAGHRDSTMGSYDAVGKTCRYWSSTISSENSQYVYAWDYVSTQDYGDRIILVFGVRCHSIRLVFED